MKVAALRHAVRAVRRPAQFRTEAAGDIEVDARIPAIATAIPKTRTLHINARSKAPRRVHPRALVATAQGWFVEDALSGGRIALAQCGDINISAHGFTS